MIGFGLTAPVLGLASSTGLVSAIVVSALFGKHYSHFPNPEWGALILLGLKYYFSGILIFSITSLLTIYLFPAFALYNGLPAPPAISDLAPLFATMMMGGTFILFYLGLFVIATILIAECLKPDIEKEDK